MTSRPGLFGLWICLLIAYPAVACPASPELFLQEEPEAYIAIDKLCGLGLLPRLMTGDRGLETAEVAREAGNAPGSQDPFVDGMMRFLQLESLSRLDFRVRGAVAWSRTGEVPPNSQGFPVPDGGGLRAGGFARWFPADWFSVQARGDAVWDFNGGTIGRLEETSARIGWPAATLEAGRFSLWWGPGRHGALIFTTNAAPLDGIRIRNPRPISLGWPLRFLGEIQYDIFLARLESEGPVDYTLLSGVRLAVRPSRYLEVGVSRAMHYGGSGRGNGLSDWWNAFKGSGENDPGSNGNQLAGADMSITLPFRFQPVQAYVEMAGDDQARGHGIPLPTKWAYLGGIFLPSILGSPRWDLRFETAANHLRGNGPGWYLHAQPEYAHLYRGQVLGHHMGSDARDLFAEVHCFLLPSSYLEANVDRTERFFPGQAAENSVRVSGALIGWLTQNLRAGARVAFERVRNLGGAPGNGSRGSALSFELSWQYR